MKKPKRLTRGQYHSLLTLYNEYNEAFINLPLEIKDQFFAVLYEHYIPED